MRVTVDANVLFACLIKDSTTRRLLFNPALSLFSPEFIAEEILSQILEIRKKSGLDQNDLNSLTAKIFDQLTLVPDERLKPFLPAAASLINDPKDWLYLSCALCEDTVIWSNDYGFMLQKRIRVLTTKELVGMAGSL